MKGKKMTENGRRQNQNNRQAPQPGKTGIKGHKRMKLGSALLTVVMLVTLLSGSLFASVWEQHALDHTNNAVVAFETPVSEQASGLIYKTRVKEGDSWDSVSNIILSDGYAYVASGRSLLKISGDGEIAATAELTGTMNESIAYADGRIYLYADADGQGFVEAVDVVNMSTVWTSTTIETYQAFSAITISDGMLYVPVSHYDFANWQTQAPGAILRLDTRSKDENPELEVLFEDPEMTFENNAIALNAQYLYIGNKQGDLLAISREHGSVEAKVETGQIIRSAVTTDGQFAYFGTGSGVGSIELDENGLFVEESLRLLDLGVQSTTPPVVYQNTLFAGTGGFQGGKGLHVIDTQSMEVLFTAETAGYDNFADEAIEIAGIQSSPLLTTAYDDAVYLYYAINAVPGSLLMLRYEAGSTDAEAVEIFVPDEADQNYTGSDIVADEQGVLYYTNDAGYLFAVGKVDPAEEAETQVPEEADENGQETIPPTGRLAGSHVVMIMMLVLLTLSLAVALIFSGKKHHQNR